MTWSRFLPQKVELFEYYYCANLEDYGNSLSAAKPPHLFGGFADYVYALPGSYLFKVPEDLPVEMAVLTELMAVTNGLDKAKQFSAVDSEGFRFGDTVVVQGVGPLGLCHVIKARMLGAGNIMAIDRSQFRLNCDPVDIISRAVISVIWAM